MLRTIDTWLLDRVFQRLADWICDRYQKTVFMTARICIYLVFLNLVLRNLVEFNGEPNIMDFLLGALLPTYVLIAIGNEERKLGRSGYGMMNGMREGARFLRYLYILLMPFTVPLNVIRLIGGGEPFLLTLIVLVGSLLMVAGVYFGSCTPKPPKPQEDEVPADAVLES